MSNYLQQYICKCTDEGKKQMVKAAASIISDTYGGELSEEQMDMFINGFICGIWWQFESPLLEPINS